MGKRKFIEDCISRYSALLYRMGQEHDLNELKWIHTQTHVLAAQKTALLAISRPCRNVSTKSL